MARLGRRGSSLSAVVAALVAIAGWWVAQHGGTSAATGHGSGSSYSSSSSAGRTALPVVALSSLPPEAADTVALIDEGGPFPYPDHDDRTFGNFEGLLPAEPSGYYREYTVITPGSPDRGARRIIKGEDGTLYWTGDHYEHFAVISR